MRESSFCGGYSLKTGALIIGILHLMCTPLVWLYLNHSHYDIRPWSPFIFMLIPLTLLQLFGTVERNADCVFPFVCMHFVIILMLICDISNQLINMSVLRYTHVDDSIMFVVEAFVTFLIIYFFTVIYAFYHELLHEKFSSLMSIDDSVNSRKAVNIHSILNNFEYTQTIKKNSEKEAVIECEDVKKPIV